MIDYTDDAIFAHPKGTRRELTKPREDRKHDAERTKVIKAALMRDKFQCRCCGYDRNLHPHEIKYRSKGGDALRLSNVIVLCRLCHMEGEHGRTGKGKTLRIIGTDANKTIRFEGPWLDYIRKYRARAGRREGGMR